MAIDKSLRQHYETQGGVKNYLGKQKMVKAPKHWLSKPGHVKAKLAYITDEEEQILIDKNLYGSLRGRPNKGPAGLPSLQGGDYGAGSGSSGGGGGQGGAAEAREQAIAARHTPAPAPRVSPQQSMAMTGNTSLAGKTQSDAQASVDRDNAREAPPGEKGGAGYVSPEELRNQEIKNLIAKQQEEKYDTPVAPTKFGETITKLDVAISKPENERTIDD